MAHKAATDGVMPSDDDILRTGKALHLWYPVDEFKADVKAIQDVARLEGRLAQAKARDAAEADRVVSHQADPRRRISDIKRKRGVIFFPDDERVLHHLVMSRNPFK
jgi:hypothetical protein